MDQYVRTPSCNKVSMYFIDGKVVGVSMVGCLPVEVPCVNRLAVCGEQVVARVDVLGFLPFVVGNVPEVMVLSWGRSRPRFDPLGALLNAVSRRSSTGIGHGHRTARSKPSTT